MGVSIKIRGGLLSAPGNSKLEGVPLRLAAAGLFFSLLSGVSLWVICLLLGVFAKGQLNRGLVAAGLIGFNQLLPCQGIMHSNRMLVHCILKAKQALAAK